MANVKELHSEVLNMRKGLHDVREKITKHEVVIEDVVKEQKEIAKELATKISWKLFIPFFLLMAGIVGGMFWLVYDDLSAFRKAQQEYNLDSGQKLGEVYGFIKYLEEQTKTQVQVSN